MDQSAEKPKEGKRVGFFLDPLKSDAELAKLIMEIAREQFPQLRESDSAESTAVT